MHLMIWFIDSSLENIFSASIVGLVYGSVWPGALGLITELLPEEFQMISMALMSAFGSLGAGEKAFSRIAHRVLTRIYSYIPLPRRSYLKYSGDSSIFLH